MSFPIPFMPVGYPASRKENVLARVTRMGEFSLAELLESRRGEDLDLWARTINPQFARVLRTIGFDRTWARAEGAYLFDADAALSRATEAVGAES